MFLFMVIVCLVMNWFVLFVKKSVMLVMFFGCLVIGKGCMWFVFFVIMVDCCFVWV